MEEMCGIVGSGNCAEEGQGDCGYNDNEAKSESVLSFMEALHSSQSEHSCMLKTSPKQTKQMLLILNCYYSI
jgi:hypothetical protein